MDKLICIGKNYLKHAQELGDTVPDEPLYFIKPPSTLFEVDNQSTATVHWPNEGELHHELELVFRLKLQDSQWSFSHFTVGLDMTRRDLQNQLKKAGHPWEKAKTFANAAVIGPWQPLQSMEEVLNLEFSLSINGSLCQRGFGRDMRWKPDEALIDLQRWFPLRDGDLLFTGSPEGTGPVVHGDVLEIRAGQIQFEVHAERS